jgi:hypothetical protein
MKVLSTNTRTSTAVSPGSSGSAASAPPAPGPPCFAPLVHAGLGAGDGTLPLRQHDPTSGGRVTYLHAALT